MLEVTGLWTIREYVRRRKETITDYVSGRLIKKMYKQRDYGGFQ